MKRDNTSQNDTRYESLPSPSLLAACLHSTDLHIQHCNCTLITAAMTTSLETTNSITHSLIFSRYLSLTTRCSLSTPFSTSTTSCHSLFVTRYSLLTVIFLPSCPFPPPWPLNTNPAYTYIQP